METAMRCCALLLLASLTLASAPSLAVADDSTPLPNGANAINETYGDWTTHCQTSTKTDQPKGAVQCAVSLVEVDQKTKQRILTLVFNPGDNGSVKGVLILPFGLSLQNGVTIQIDDGPATSALMFRTCLPAGCLISLDWPSQTVEALGNSKQLKINAQSDQGQAAPFVVSLNGVGPALARAASLVGKQ
jgi:invasion protein IalB